jgi:hypothetical protein
MNEYDDGLECNQPNKIWQHGHVYLIDYGDLKTFKIGYTTIDPSKRIKQIAKYNVIMPMKLVMSVETYTNAYFLENIIQMALDDYNVLGEWFELDFPMLVNLYRCLAFFGNITLYDHWYKVVPPDYDEFIKHGVLDNNYPTFTLKEKDKIDDIFNDLSEKA